MVIERRQMPAATRSRTAPGLVPKILTPKAIAKIDKLVMLRR
jgi:hypothetical protein